MEKWKNAAIACVEMERSAGKVKVIIKTSRPGVLIGRGGTGIEDIRKLIKRNLFKIAKKAELDIDVQEIKRLEDSAMLVAQEVAQQLERRIPFRRVLKTMLEQVMENRNVKGVKLEVSGRLDGSEMSRREWLSKGSLPLHTLRADVDFAEATAKTTYGTVGVKAWIYKGIVFNK